MDLYRFSEVEMLGFVLVLLRLSAFFVTWPILGSEAVPAPVKILTSLVVTIIVFPVIGYKKLQVGIVDNQIIILAAREITIGVIIGFISRFFFFSLAMAGQIISVSMGLSSAQLFNPGLNLEGTAVEQFKVMLGSIFFLMINGHHLLITAIVKSFEFAPLGIATISFAGMSDLASVMTIISTIAIKIAAPVMVSIFFVNISLGIAGRAVPQINVLVTSMAVNTLVGFGAMIIALPLFVTEISDIVNETTTRLFQLMKSF